MLDQLFIKYLCVWNVINICNSDIITAYGTVTLLLHMAQWHYYCIWHSDITAYDTVTLLLHMAQWHYCIWHSDIITAYATVTLLLHMPQWHYYCIWHSDIITAYGTLRLLLHMPQWHYFCIWHREIITAYATVTLLLHMAKWRYSYRINIYPYFVTIYRDIFLLNRNDMSHDECNSLNKVYKVSTFSNIRFWEQNNVS